MAEATIRPMTAADIEPAALALERGDWGDRRVFFRAIAEQACFDPLVAELHGELVGTALGTRFGSVGWVGLIYVVPERRRLGLGSALAGAACERLEGAGCRSLVLVATDAGQPIYRRLGFSATGRYRTFEAPGLDARGFDPAGAARGFDPAGAARAADHIRPIEAGDLVSLTALDRQATGEDRAVLVGYLASAGSGLVRFEAAGLAVPVGYLLRPPWGGGGLVARDPMSALALLTARRAAAGPGRRVRAGLLDANEAGCRAILAAGWTEGWSGARMTRGHEIAWRPDMIYGQFSFATG